MKEDTPIHPYLRSEDIHFLDGPTEDDRIRREAEEKADPENEDFEDTCWHTACPCCRLCCGSRLKRWACLCTLILIVLLVGLALLIAYLVVNPSVPEVQIYDTNLANGAQSLRLTLLPPILHADLVINASLDNRNSFDIYLNNLTVDVRHASFCFLPSLIFRLL